MYNKKNNTDYYSMSVQGHMATLLLLAMMQNFKESPEDVFKEINMDF